MAVDIKSVIDQRDPCRCPVSLASNINLNSCIAKEREKKLFLSDILGEIKTPILSCILMLEISCSMDNHR